jgi:hypothetical protein
MDDDMRIFVLLALLASPALADISTVEPRPQKLSTTDLVRLYTVWFNNPYDYMFDQSGPKFSVNGREYGRFIAGIGGIVRYGGIIDAAAQFVKKQPQPSFGDLEPIERLAGRRIYTAPMRVNPDFVRWAVQNTVPPPETRILDHTAKEYYDHLFSRFFRLMAAAHVWLDGPGRLERERAAYFKASTSAKFDGVEYLEKHFDGVLPAYAMRADGTAFTPAMAIGFWLRRSADGTAPELWSALQKMLTAYDPQFKARGDELPAR